MLWLKLLRLLVRWMVLQRLLLRSLQLRLGRLSLFLRLLWRCSMQIATGLMLRRLALTGGHLLLVACTTSSPCCLEHHLIVVMLRWLLLLILEATVLLHPCRLRWRIEGHRWQEALTHREIWLLHWSSRWHHPWLLEHVHKRVHGHGWSHRRRATRRHLGLNAWLLRGCCALVHMLQLYHLFVVEAPVQVGLVQLVDYLLLVLYLLGLHLEVGLVLEGHLRRGQPVPLIALLQLLHVYGLVGCLLLLCHHFL